MTTHSLDFLRHAVGRSPQKTALLSIDGTSISYQELWKKVCLDCHWLRQQGVRSGDRVGMYFNDAIELMSLMFATWGIGAVALPINVTLPDDKRQNIESRAKPTLGVIGSKIELASKPLFRCISYTDARTGELSEPETAAPTDIAIIMFTSGTSGVPKAVPMSHGAIARNALATAEELKLTAGDRILVNSPPYYTSPIIHHLTLMSKGGSVVSSEGFLFGGKLVELLEEYQCTGFGGVPVHFTRILGAIQDQMPVPSRLRFLMNSGEHLPVPTLTAVQEALPHIEIFCVYGLTEVAGRLCILAPEFTQTKVGSVGFPLPGMTISIRNEEGEELPPNERGEVFVTGPNLMSGYLDAPEINEKLMTAMGFATGDIGYKDADGFLFLDGRQDDIIKVGGEKVSIRVIEDAATGFEGLADIIVAPLYDAHLGLVPCLYYVESDTAEFKKKALRKHMKSVLPSNHVPTKYIQVESIPRNTSGKRSRKAFIASLE